MSWRVCHRTVNPSRTSPAGSAFAAPSFAAHHRPLATSPQDAYSGALTIEAPWMGSQQAQLREPRSCNHDSPVNPEVIGRVKVIVPEMVSPSGKYCAVTVPVLFLVPHRVGLDASSPLPKQIASCSSQTRLQSRQCFIPSKAIVAKLAVVASSRICDFN